MNALKCDRCKRYYDIKDNNSSTEYISCTEYIFCYKEGRIDNSVKHLDLCPECSRELNKWMEDVKICK